MKSYYLPICLIIILSFTSATLWAQEDSSWHQKPTLTLSGFADLYYVYDLNRPQGSMRQTFLFNHNRHNEVNVNLAMLKIALENPKYRANIAFQAGTYAQDNYAAEDDLLKGVFEANVGIALSQNNRHWLDMGIFPSHIGFESALSMNNLTLTRSLAAENSPYFLSGAKYSYRPSEKWELAALYLNGWQRIRRLEGNSLPSFGTQLSFTPHPNTTLNWSTFLGTDTPDSTRRMRYFNNFYGQFRLMPAFQLIVGVDVGAQQEFKGSSNLDWWFGPVIIGKLAFNKVWSTSLRAEYYQDKTGIILPTGTRNGFQTMGFSINLDYAPSPALLWRLETRWMDSKDRIFETKAGFSDDNLIIATSLAIKFSEYLSKKH